MSCCLVIGFPTSKFNGHGSEVVGVSKAVDAAYAGNYDGVVSADYAGDGVHAHFFYLLIYS